MSYTVLSAFLPVGREILDYIEGAPGIDEEFMLDYLLTMARSGEYQTIIWDTDDYHLGKILDVPSHVTLNKGDTIVTSGISMIFPEGIVIGTVEESSNNPNLDFSEGILRFVTNFNSLQNVYVIDNLLKNEQQSLLELKDE